MYKKFEDLGLNEKLIDAVKKLGFEKPSPIQALTIPIALGGKDIIGLSQTGSGKTAAFALPLLNAITIKDYNIQVLVVCPTRELAMQVCDEIHKLASNINDFRAIAVYGGAPIDRQIKALKKGVHIVVGTPGRIMDHIRKKTLKLNSTSACVLDEADRMLDMGFRDDMEVILNELPKQRQTMFFSATMNKNVNGLIEKFSNNPESIKVKEKSLTVDTIEQTYYEVRNRSKVEVLSRLLDMETDPKGIIFCNTKQMVEEVCEILALRGYVVDRIHGDITQNNREKVIKKFREGKIELLVATDVAARGLDIDEVGIVFNYDLPYDPEDYVHRIGRTGRAGKLGKSVTFIFGKDIYKLEAIERFTNQTIRKVKIPSQEDVEGMKADFVLNKVRDKLENKNFERYEHYLNRLLNAGHSTTDITSALFDLLANQENREMEKITEDSEPFSTSRKISNIDYNQKRKRKRPSRNFNSRKKRDSFQNIKEREGSQNAKRRKKSKVRKDKGKPKRAFSNRS